MIERSWKTCFTEESDPCIAGTQEERVDHFEGSPLLENGVLSQIDGSHAARADATVDTVHTDRLID
jgi:hypothetical protein